MFGHNKFQWLLGEGFNRQSGTTSALNLSDADAAAGTLLSGTLVDFTAGYTDRFSFVTGSAIGFITQPIDQYGQESATQFRKRELQPQGKHGHYEVPVKKGDPVAVLIPPPNSQAIFEGLGAASYGNLVVTSSTGAISTATARRTELSVIKGGLYVAQAGDLVIALMEQADLTPVADAGNVRVRVRFVSPYVKG